MTYHVRFKRETSLLFLALNCSFLLIGAFIGLAAGHSPGADGSRQRERLQELAFRGLLLPGLGLLATYLEVGRELWKLGSIAQGDARPFYRTGLCVAWRARLVVARQDD
jgi:hypothetical protein